MRTLSCIILSRLSNGKLVIFSWKSIWLILRSVSTHSIKLIFHTVIQFIFFKSQSFIFAHLLELLDPLLKRVADASSVDFINHNEDSLFSWEENGWSMGNDDDKIENTHDVGFPVVVTSGQGWFFIDVADQVSTVKSNALSKYHDAEDGNSKKCEYGYNGGDTEYFDTFFVCFFFKCAINREKIGCEGKAKYHQCKRWN